VEPANFHLRVQYRVALPLDHCTQVLVAPLVSYPADRVTHGMTDRTVT